MEDLIRAVPEYINFPEEEEKIIEFWAKEDAFKTQLKLSADKPRFTFYDGPPFATGLPHYGHLLAGTIKDIVTRWACASGFHVERRFGWDTHGLPVEYEIDKALDIKGPQDVEKMGIAAYNNKCREIVMRYAKEWRHTVSRLGRWIDFDNDYKTLYPWYMESIWWVFSELYKKDLVYRGVKVMPFSTACSTPLSNFESGLNYKEVVDPAVFVAFPLEEDPNVSIVAWTTTPWTLPSNLALCVHPDQEYVKLKDNKSDAIYIMMEACVSSLYKKPAEYTVIEKFAGKTLADKKYRPLFPYFESWREKYGAFRVLTDTYVTTESGTGIVHQAPFFGEDDYRVCMANGIISKDGELACPIDPAGRFIDPVTDFTGLYVKDADKEIIKRLKNDKRLVKQEQTKHNYPFCWRSDTPLIYRAVPSWFVRVEHMQEKLISCNSQTYWVPDFVKEKRFGNWLRDARDWAVSRNRYWGTPIPLWVSDDGEEVVCISSIAELEKLSGVKVTDLHRENVDPIEIASQKGKGTLKRVTEVFDCWFESGSMPYAQVHYPFENKETFEKSFPADFIAEGVDQTRGWFYTLLVLSTALFDKPPFKNLIANGLVLASDGQKMSKRKKNYPDPLEVIGKYGADATRLYLINSPVVRAESLRFREEGVKDILKDVFLPWFNAFRFMMQNVGLYCGQNETTLSFDPRLPPTSDNLMDRWILSFTQSLLKFVKQEMAAYRLYTVIPRLIKFVDNLTNWFVRMNRKRLKGDTDSGDSKDEARKSIETLFFVLFQLIQMMSPFSPFLCEFMYQKLRPLLIDDASVKVTSVHHLALPEVNEKLIDENVERRVAHMQSVIDVGRLLRTRANLPIKHPLKEVIVISNNQTALQDVKGLESYILSELNIRTLTVTSEREKYGVTLKGIPDIKALGMRLKNQSKSVISAIRNLSEDDLMKYQSDPENFSVDGVTLQLGELKIQYALTSSSDQDSTSSTPATPSDAHAKYEADGQGELLVLLDTQADSELEREGLAREVVNRVQKLRKKANLVPTDPIAVYYACDGDESTTKSIQETEGFISSLLKAPFTSLVGNVETEGVLISETQPLKQSQLKVVITSRKE